MSEPLSESAAALRPAQVCAQLLLALDASDGRRARRKRNTTPDTVGQEIKRDLLRQVIAGDPAPEEFDAWLLARCMASSVASGPSLAMARDILAEWRDALAVPDFRAWLAAGAPSDDRRDESRHPKGT